jgi:hypothetical protein
MKGLPRYAVGLMKAPLKRDALRTVKNFKEGIKRNSFALQKLKDETVYRKRLLGMERPNAPLYGMGDSVKKKSYINMLRIKELKNGWKLYPSWAKHYSAAIKLNLLFFVHEYGTIIKGRGGVMIRIPPRPALLKAFLRTMKQRRMKEDCKLMKQAMIVYARTGRIKALQQMEKQFVRGLEKFEDSD